MRHVTLFPWLRDQLPFFRCLLYWYRSQARLKTDLLFMFSGWGDQVICTQERPGPIEDSGPFLLLLFVFHGFSVNDLPPFCLTLDAASLSYHAKFNSVLTMTLPTHAVEILVHLAIQLPVSNRAGIICQNINSAETNYQYHFQVIDISCSKISEDRLKWIGLKQIIQQTVRFFLSLSNVKSSYLVILSTCKPVNPSDSPYGLHNFHLW